MQNPVQIILGQVCLTSDDEPQPEKVKKAEGDKRE